MKVKKRRAMGIGAKTLFSHILLAVLVVLLFSLLIFQFMYRFLKDEHHETMLSKARYIAANLQISGEGVMMPDHRVIRTYESLSNARICILDGEGDTFADDITRDETDKTNWKRHKDIEALKRRLLYGKENGGKAGEDHGD